MHREITQAEAIRLIEQGAAYWAPQCHTPICGTLGQSVVFLEGKFYVLPSDEFDVKPHKVMKLDRGTMIMAHAVMCSNDTIGEIMRQAVADMMNRTGREPWAQDFLRQTEQLQPRVGLTPREGRRWYNRFIVETHDAALEESVV